MEHTRHNGDDLGVQRHVADARQRTTQLTLT